MHTSLWITSVILWITLWIKWSTPDFVTSATRKPLTCGNTKVVHWSKLLVQNKWTTQTRRSNHVFRQVVHGWTTQNRKTAWTTSAFPQVTAFSSGPVHWSLLTEGVLRWTTPSEWAPRGPTSTAPGKGETR